MPLNKFVLIASLVLLLGASGCAKAPPRAATGEGGVRTDKAAALENSLWRYAERTAAIKALVWLEIADGEEERRTEAAMLISRPQSIRVDAMDALADVWAKAGSDGARLWLYLPARDKLYSGRASRGNLRRLVKFDWDLSEIISAIAGSPPVGADPEILQVGAPRDNHFIVRGGGVHLWTDPKSNRPVKCARYQADGSTLDYTMTFGGYRRVDGVDFPHRIEASFEGRGARIVVLYRDVSLGGAVDHEAFLAPTHAKGRTVELKD